MRQYTVKKRKNSEKKWNGIRWKILFILSVFIILICILVYKENTGLKITFLDVGQGDGIFLETQNGSHIFIDGGSSSQKEVGKYSILPFLKSEGVKKLDYWIVSHPDSDHINGIEQMIEEGYEIDQLLLPEIKFEDEAYKTLINFAEKFDIKTDYMKEGDVLREEKLQMICLHPFAGLETEEANDYSLVFMLKYGFFNALFTGDLSGEWEDEVEEAYQKNMKEKGRLTLLKVAHHGSKYSTTERFLEVFRPQYAVISCGENNSYGHPHKEVLERLRKNKTTIYRTDENGAVTVKINKNHMKIETFK